MRRIVGTMLVVGLGMCCMAVMSTGAEKLVAPKILKINQAIDAYEAVDNLNKIEVPVLNDLVITVRYGGMQFKRSCGEYATENVCVTVEELKALKGVLNEMFE